MFQEHAYSAFSLARLGQVKNFYFFVKKMPKFLENPSLLTKERLKADLRTHGVELPKGEQRKDVYVQLYLEHLTARNKDSPSLGAGDFSSDEEDSSAINSPAKPANRPQPKLVIRKPVKGLPYDVHSLSDGDLARQLKSYGQVVGPITETTRPLYQKKLVKILQEESKNPASSQKVDSKPKPWEYSDTEEDDEKPRPEADSREEKILENGDVNEDDDEIDAFQEAPAVRQQVRQSRKRPPPPKEPEEDAPAPAPVQPPNVVKRETVIQETYMETRKRATAENSASETRSTVRQEVTPKVTNTKPKQGESFLWKAVLVLVAMTTIALLVFYCMEGNPDKPSITNKSR